jgi:small subunit ribosomal protein S8
MHTDPIADYLTRIRNAQAAGHRVVEIPSSKMKVNITRILKDQGYILNYKVYENEKGHPVLKIALKYDKETGEPVIKGMKRVSKPGLRKYTDVRNMPKVINGLGIAIISTPKGVMTDKEARRENVGGEVIAYIY